MLEHVLRICRVVVLSCEAQIGRHPKPDGQRLHTRNQHPLPDVEFLTKDDQWPLNVLLGDPAAQR